MKKALVGLLSLILSGCHGYPTAVTPVKNFDIDRYLGKWYEIARLDHSFERGLEHVTAEYTLQDDGQIKVVNRGFSESKNEWKEAVGKASFSQDTDEGYLKVSFFGPFYSSYVVFGLDQENYQYAFICGPNLSYLWLLSRTPQVEKEIVELFIKTAAGKGFATEDLIYVRQK